MVYDYLSEDEYTAFQQFLHEQPEAGDVVKGSGGIRKVRWARGGSGKSGGVRDATASGHLLSDVNDLPTSPGQRELTRFSCAASRQMTRSLRYGKVTSSQGEILMQAVTAAKRETLNIRIKPEVRDLIDRAAKSRGKNRTDFILDAARLAAEDALLDQVIMSVSPQAFEQFQARLDMPPNANGRLCKTMLTPAPWERE